MRIRRSLPVKLPTGDTCWEPPCRKTGYRLCRFVLIRTARCDCAGRRCREHLRSARLFASDRGRSFCVRDWSRQKYSRLISTKRRSRCPESSFASTGARRDGLTARFLRGSHARSCTLDQRERQVCDSTRQQPAKTRKSSLRSLRISASSALSFFTTTVNAEDAEIRRDRRADSKNYM
jgi:hypothetical protein